MNRILILAGFLLCFFSGFSKDFPNSNENVAYSAPSLRPLLCGVPEGLFVSARDTVASLNWLSRGTNVMYQLQWKPRLDSVWKTVDVQANTFLLRGVHSCTEYEFRVKTLCGIGEMSAYSESKKFKTIGCAAPCTTPHQITNETGETKASFKWASTGARAYEIQIQDATNNGAWRTEIVTTNTFTALNLRNCNKYFFRIRSICTEATASTPVMYSEWSSTVTVATTGCQTRCVAPRRIYYSANTTTAVIKWDATTGATYELQVKKVTDTEWRTISNIRTPYHELTDLANCTYYQARVRTNCSASSSSPWSYIIRFKTGGCAAVCKKPESVKVFVADTIAVFTWVAPQASKFVFEYKTETAASWTSATITGNVYVLTHLSRCNKYIVRIKSVCSATSMSDYSSEAKFQTGGCAAECATPRVLTAKIVDTVNAILGWTNVGARAYIIEFKNLSNNSAEYRTDTVFTNTFTVKNLLKCTKYAYRIRSICGNHETAPSEIFIFATEGCGVNPSICEAPKNLKTEIGQDTIVYFNWAGTQNVKYEIQYQVANGTVTDWVSVTVNASEHKLILKRCTGYYWRVRRICDNGVSDWSELGKFETKGCVIPVVCQVPAFKAALLIDSIVQAGWLAPSGKIEIQYRIVSPNTGEWISEKFEGVSETKLKLHACKVYEIHSRSICADGTVSNWSESYKIETKGCTPTNLCETPTNLKSAVARDTIAELAWTGATATKYEVQFRLSGSGDAGWKSVTTDVPSFRIVELKRCTVYEWKVRKICSNNTTSAWSEIQKFATLGCVINPTTCLAPANFTVKADGALAYASWTNVFDHDTVIIQYRKSTDIDFNPNFLVGTTPNGVILRGLENCKEYIVRVRRKCANGTFSDWVEKSVKLTVNCLIEGGETNSLLRKSVTNATIYPNPGNEYVQVEYTLTEGADVKVQLVNIQGQVVKQLNKGIQEAGSYMQALDNISEIGQGIYFIIIRTDGKVASSQKWMKQ